MNKILKNTIIFGSTGLVAAGAGAGIVTGIILPKALKAKDKLSSFVSKGGGSVDLKARYAKKGKLKVVALGDSVTAGYNGYLAGSLKEGVMSNEYYSYSDFLVHSLRESLGGKEKVEYKNYAKSGLRLADYKTLLESGDLNRQLNDADIIPITIGANDILALLKLFRMPFWMGQNLLGNVTGILKSYNVDPNKGPVGWIDKIPTTNTTPKPLKTAIESAKKVWKSFDNFIYKGSIPKSNDVRNSGEGNTIFSKNDSKLMFNNTIDDLIAIANGETGRYLNLDRDWVKNVYDLIEREITTMIRDIHKTAPFAQIVVIGHALPFAQFPIDTLFEKNKNMDNENLLKSFDKLLERMKDGAKNSLGENGFVDFFKADELGEMKKYSWNLKNLDKSYDIYSKYKKDKAAIEADKNKDGNAKEASIKKLTDEFLKKTIYDDPKTKGSDYKYHHVSYKTPDLYKGKESGVKEQPLSNILDIHPSVFGHQLMGNALFKIYADRIGISKENIAKGLKAGQSVADDPTKDVMFERWDEDDAVILGAKNARFIKAKTFNALLSSWSSIPDGILDKLKETILKIPTTNNPAADQIALTKALKAYANQLFKILVKQMKPELAKNEATLNAALTLIKPKLDPFINKYIESGWKNGETQVPALSQLAGLYKMANNQMNSPKGDEQEKIRWSIYGIASFFSLAQTLTEVLQNAQEEMPKAILG